MSSYIEWLYERTCSRKVAYKTPHQAVDGLHASVQMHNGKHYQTYQCRFCGLWHVGSNRN